MSVVGCIYSGKHLSGICLVGEMSVGDMSGRGSVRRGCVWLGKCSSGMCLVRKMSIGDVSGWRNVYRGRVHRGNVRRRCVRKSLNYCWHSGLQKDVENFVCNCHISQLTSTCSKSTIETLEKV